MKRHCLIALPLLLAGCSGETLLMRYQGTGEINLVRLAPSLEGQFLASSGNNALPQDLHALAQDNPAETDNSQRAAISVIRAELARAESNRQKAERQLRRLHAGTNNGHGSHSAVEQQHSILRIESTKVAELRASLKAAELACRQAAHAPPKPAASSA